MMISMMFLKEVMPMLIIFYKEDKHPIKHRNNIVSQILMKYKLKNVLLINILERLITQPSNGA